MLYADIHRQRLKLVNEHVVADTIDYLEMKFNFRTDDWGGLTKWAHFANGDTVYDIPLTDDCIRKEDHLNLSAGVWKVYLHGNEFADGKVVERITTCVENLRVYPTGSLDGEPFPEMPASVTEQILARLEDIEQNGTGGGSGTVTSVAGVEPDESGNVPLTPADIGAAEIKVTDEEINLVTVVGKAAVGQTIVVDAVDEDGYPMSWHAVDLPEGIPGEPGTNGITPHIGEDGYWYIGDTNTGVKAAGTDGAPGTPGTDGITPHIGENNNWYIGDTDTGVTAVGRDGAPGEKGDPGEPGDDYVLTAADKAEIAQEAAGLIDTALLGIIGSGEVTT